MKDAIDTMSVMRAIKVKETFKEWFKTVVKFTLPSSSLKPLSIEYVNDVFKVLVLRAALEMKEDNLRHEYTWKVEKFSFKNKQHLFSLFLTYLCADDFVQPSPLPILVNNENGTFKISFECNHEEANTRLVFHALQQNTNVVLCSKDRDIRVLMVFVYALNKINEKWNISEPKSPKGFPKFMQLQSVTQLKLKCLNGKENLTLLNTIGVSCKVSDC